MPPTTLTEEAEARIVRDDSAGIRALEIAQREGVAGGTIYRVLRSHRIEPGRHQRKRSNSASSENNRLRAALRLAPERLDAADADDVRRVAGDVDLWDQSATYDSSLGVKGPMVVLGRVELGPLALGLVVVLGLVVGPGSDLSEEPVLRM